MDETSFADIDGRVADMAPAAGGKEQQITRFQVITPDSGAPHGVHLASRTWQSDTGRASVDIVDQTAAIEAAIRAKARKDAESESSDS